MSQTIFSLKQVAQSIKKTLDARYNSTYWVKAEIYKLNLFPSGHAFPELVQREDGKIAAQLTGVIWKTNYVRIKSAFEKTVQEPLSEGKEVLMQIKITFSEVHGLSLNILEIDPSFSLGALHRIRIETLKKLNEEGVLANNQKLELLLPKRIALISAASSKGLSDFAAVMEAYQNRFGIRTFLFNCALQGDQAITSILTALGKIETLQTYFDAVVIVRGGGAEVGMSCYDDYRLCKKIACFPLPVLTGIGHSTNLTVAEMVAFSHAITPSVLANDLMQMFIQEEKHILGCTQFLRNSSKILLEEYKYQFQGITKRLPSTTYWRIEQQKSLLGLSQNKLSNSSKNQFSYANNKLERLHSKIQDVFYQSKLRNHHQLNTMGHKLNFLGKNISHREFERLGQIEKSVSILNPKSILKRGYSITRHKGSVVTSIDHLKNGDLIETELFETLVNSIVKR